MSILTQDAQDSWTCTMVDDGQNPRVTLRKTVPLKDASAGEAREQPQVSWFPCLTDDSDTETDSPLSPPSTQVTTRTREEVDGETWVPEARKRVTVAKKERGPMIGWWR